LDKDGSVKIKAFRDHEVHEVLKNSGFNNVTVGETTGREWFAIDVQTAKKAIDAVKHNYANLSNSDVVRQAPIIFRPEQAECIAKVVKHFKKSDRFLINAKMRYGKTFVSLEIIKQCKFKKTIIITHRPVVDAGWYEDFNKILSGNKEYIYGSKASGYTLEKLLSTEKPFIYFASVQDLRGSSQVGGKFDKVMKALGAFEELLRANDEKIEDLKAEFEKRNPTQIEKLSMQTDKSYPFNVTPEEFWKQKEATSNYSTENDDNGKEQGQYVITANDVNGDTNWKAIADSLDDDDFMYHQTLDKIMKM